MQYYRQSYADPRYFIRTNRALFWLIAINAILWGLVAAGRVFAFLFAMPDQEFTGQIASQFALPADPRALLSRPWTLFTYMFLHIDFFHILFNLLWLFWFGKIFLEFLSKKKLVWTYLLGGIFGGLTYVFFYNYFPVFSKNVGISFALGASAAVMGIVSSISFYVPRYTIQLFLIGKVRILYIAILLFVLDFFMIRSDNSGGHIAHIGGALYGMGFALWLKESFRLKDWWRSLRSHRISGSKNGRKTNSGFPGSQARPQNDEEYNSLKAERQRKIDDILDKISKSGYESLSKEEKEFLFKASEKGK